MTAIVCGNAMAFFGVFYWGWSLFEIFYLYWLENVILGAFTWLRMLLSGAANGIAGLLGALFMMGFFTIHYGMFCTVHGIFVVDLFYSGDIQAEFNPFQLLSIPFTIGIDGFIWILAGIILVEFVYFLQAAMKDRSKNRPLNAIMGSPYGRIVVLHLTIIFGGLAAQEMGVSMIALALFVFLKTVYDLSLFSFISQEQKEQEKQDAERSPI